MPNLGAGALDSPAGSEPPVHYVVVVNLLPQDATKAEKAFVWANR